MKLIKYQEPLAVIDDFTEEMNRLFSLTLGGDIARTDAILPLSLDISEDKNCVYVEADLPGFEQKDIKVSTRGKRLTISARHEERKEEKRKDCYCSERFQGRYFREVVLPSSVHTNKVEAAYKNGVLKLTLPKTADERSRGVRIKRS